MKIIFANRRNCLSSPGGDTVQMLKTIEYLKKNYNLDITICLSPEEIINDKEASIVHIFNIQSIDATLELIKASKDSGKKVALSPVYWDVSHSIYVYKMFQLFNITSNIRYVKNFKNLVVKGAVLRGILPKGKINNSDSFATQKYINTRRRALIEADYILPNSNEEFDIICREFNFKKEELKHKIAVIPNAVDINQDNKGKASIDRKANILNEIKDFVLEVGRIEVNKNQYGVVKALFDRPEIPIVFIGRVSDNKVEKEYYEKLRELSEKRGNVFFINQISQEEVFEYYKKAKVHVLPSFRESPGLSSLEALYFGCNIVTSDSEFCPVKYYKFDEKANTCNPYDYLSIRKAILNAYSCPKNQGFDEEYFKYYSYDNVSSLMNEVYSKLSK